MTEKYQLLKCGSRWEWRRSAGFCCCYYYDYYYNYYC